MREFRFVVRQQGVVVTPKPQLHHHPRQGQQSAQAAHVLVRDGDRTHPLYTLLEDYGGGTVAHYIDARVWKFPPDGGDRRQKPDGIPELIDLQQQKRWRGHVAAITLIAAHRRTPAAYAARSSSQQCPRRH